MHMVRSSISLDFASCGVNGSWRFSGLYSTYLQNFPPKTFKMRRLSPVQSDPAHSIYPSTRLLCSPAALISLRVYAPGHARCLWYIDVSALLPVLSHLCTCFANLVIRQKWKHAIIVLCRQFLIPFACIPSVERKNPRATGSMTDGHSRMSVSFSRD
ncbi:hypothetical protein BKA81DRAFT_109336 [Phyllosticta paracitricarpa]